MHTYRQSKDAWIVGFELPHNWRVIKKFSNEKDAAAYVSYLNGGAPPVRPPTRSRKRNRPGER